MTPASPPPAAGTARRPTPSAWQVRVGQTGLALFASGLTAGAGSWLARWAATEGLDVPTWWDWSLVALWIALALGVALCSAWARMEMLRPRWLRWAWRDALAVATGWMVALGCGLSTLLGTWSLWLNHFDGSSWRTLGLPLACGAGLTLALLLGGAARALPQASAKAVLRGLLPIDLRNELLLLAACACPLLPLVWIDWLRDMDFAWLVDQISGQHPLWLWIWGFGYFEACCWSLLGWLGYAAARWAMWFLTRAPTLTEVSSREVNRVWLVLSLPAAQALPKFDIQLRLMGVNFRLGSLRLNSLLRRLSGPGIVLLAPADFGVGSQFAGQHLALAQRLGWPERLRPGLPAQLADWRRTLPPPGAPADTLPLWELYPAPALMIEAALTLPGEQDRVLLVVDDDTAAAEAWRGRLDGRLTWALRARDFFSVVGLRADAASAPADGSLIAGYRSLRVWSDILDRSDADGAAEPEPAPAVPAPTTAPTPAPTTAPTTAPTSAPLPPLPPNPEPQRDPAPAGSRVYISYFPSRELDPAVEDLRNNLIRRGFEVFVEMAFFGLPHLQQIEASSVFIVIVTRAYWFSDTCRSELEHALARRRDGRLQHLLPVLGEAMNLSELIVSSGGADGIRHLGELEFLGPFDEGGQLTTFAGPALARPAIDAQVEQMVQRLLRVVSIQPQADLAAYDFSLRIEVDVEGAWRFAVLNESARGEWSQRFPAPLAQTLLRELDRVPLVAKPETLLALLRLIVPPEVTQAIAQSGGAEARFELLLDATADALPWELLLAAAVAELSARRIAPVRVVRRLIPSTLAGSTFRSLAAPAGPDFHPPRALVIGDPATSPGSKRTPLRGAQRESRQQAEALRRAGFDVQLQLQESAPPITEALLGTDWQVLVLNGHGAARSDSRDQPFFPLSDGQGLTVRDIVADRARPPEMVFANVEMLASSACSDERWLQTPGAPPQPAWADGLQSRGVRAFVLASGQLDDEMAAQFGIHVFEQLCNASTTLGEALHQARLELFEKAPQAAQWAAYRLYGDAGYRLGAASLPQRRAS